ncbi:DUF222 domain-containing protein, partial [Paenarthrobacter nitroguajacolicus]
MHRPGPVRAAGSHLATLLEDGRALLDSARLSVATEAPLFDHAEAADFAGRVEDMSRALEYLQVLAAQAVERTRTEAQMAQMARRGSAATAPAWRTGWTEPGATEPGVTDTGAGVVDPTATLALGAEAESSAAGLLDDGYRNAAEFLRARLRIGIGEARRRLALAAEVLPQTGMTGQHVPARREILAEALATAQVPSRSATIISTALDKVRHLTEPETLTRMEHALTATARQSDPDFLTKIAKRWADLIDQDGPEPTEETLRQLQGAFLRRRRRHGLHHLEIFATDEQYETLATAMNTATNPRHQTTGTDTGTGTGSGTETHDGTGTGTPDRSPAPDR